MDRIWRSLIRCDDTACKSKAGKSTLFEIVTIDDLNSCIRLARHRMIGLLTCGMISSRILLQRLVIPNSRPTSASKMIAVRYEPYRHWNSECHSALRSCSTAVEAWPTCCCQVISIFQEIQSETNIPASPKIRIVGLV